MAGKIKDWEIEKQSFIRTHKKQFKNSKDYLEKMYKIKNADSGTYFKNTRGWNKERQLYQASIVAKKIVQQETGQSKELNADMYSTTHEIISSIFNEETIKSNIKRLKSRIVKIIDISLNEHERGVYTMDMKELETVYKILNTELKEYQDVGDDDDSNFIVINPN